MFFYHQHHDIKPLTEHLVGVPNKEAGEVPQQQFINNEGICYGTFLLNLPERVAQERALEMANDGKHRFRTQLISSAARRPRCQLADLLDLYFGLSCNRYKELRGSGFPSVPVASEAWVLIPALLVHSTSILAPSKVYLSIHPSIHPCVCPLLPPH